MSGGVRQVGREILIEYILAAEFDMFQRIRVQHRAACQDDPEGFRRVRGSQFAVWSRQALESYRADLVAAQAGGRNLLQEKYARMDDPEAAAEAAPRVAEIVALQLQWQESLARRYPYLLGRGRPLRTADDTLGGTSFETYLRSELQTYSAATRELLYRDCVAACERQENLCQLSYRVMVRELGYASLEDAEAQCRQEQGADKMVRSDTMTEKTGR